MTNSYKFGLFTLESKLNNIEVNHNSFLKCDEVLKQY